MKVLLVCAAGMSTSLLVNSMKRFAQEGDVIEAFPVAELEKIADKYDVVLAGPQVRYKYGKIEQICKAKGKAVGLIDMKAYGNMDGKTVMEQVKGLLK